MPILNMVGGGKKGGNIGEPLNLTVTTSGLDATITWEDNEIGTIPPTTFQKSELVRKIGSAPTSPSDGVLVVTETVKDTYKVSGYVDSGLTGGETYYYRVFSYSDLGGISYCDAESVTPSAGGWQPGVDTLVYLPLNGDALDQSGNGRDGTLPSSSYYEWGYIDGVSGDMCYVAHGTEGTSKLISGTYADTQLGNADRTVSVRMKFIYIGTASSQVTVHRLGKAAGGARGGWFGIYCMDGYGQLGILRYYDDPYTTSFSYDNDWHNFVITYNDTNKAKMYVDGQEILLPNYTSSSFDTVGTNYFIGAARSSDGTKRVGFSNYIIEDKERTAQEIADYYDLTKGNYGIS